MGYKFYVCTAEEVLEFGVLTVLLRSPYRNLAVSIWNWNGVFADSVYFDSILCQLLGNTCFTCRSTESWEHCNNNMAKKTCPYGIEHCLRYSRQKTNNTTKTFTKDCTSHNDCSRSRLRCDEQTSGDDSCTHDCCYGELCNLGGNSKAHGDGNLASILALLLAIKFTFMEFQCF